jgi:hypothetical protein
MAQGAAKRFQSSGVKQCAQDLSAERRGREKLRITG